MLFWLAFFLWAQPPMRIGSSPGVPDAGRAFLFPQWRMFMSGNTWHRLPDSFRICNQVRATFWNGRLDASALRVVRAARAVSPESVDALFLEVYAQVLLEATPASGRVSREDTRQVFLRFFEAYRHGDFEQALTLLAGASMTVQERFLLSEFLGDYLLGVGDLQGARQLFRRALELFEFQHPTFFGMRGTEKREHYRFMVTSLAEIAFKSGDYRMAFGFLQWLGRGDSYAALDPMECRWDELLDNRCAAGDPLRLPAMRKRPADPERQAFHDALWTWGNDWSAGAAAFDGFMAKYKDSVWLDTVQDFRNWVRTVTRP